MASTFLAAEWRKLAMANYVVDPALLTPWLPYRTELDLWNETCYVSLVGFKFQNTRIKGFKIPWHINFEEVNLRFYVRYRDRDEWKRGVVFIREIVPRPAITLVANSLYGENYVTMPMHHAWDHASDELRVEYRWKKKNWNTFSVNTEKRPVPITAGSEAEFITEHYWGYTRINATRTAEYGVEHPRWEAYPVKNYRVDVNFEDVYGKPFGFLKSETPRSVFLAEDSDIIVRGGRTI